METRFQARLNACEGQAAADAQAWATSQVGMNVDRARESIARAESDWARNVQNEENESRWRLAGQAAMLAMARVSALSEGRSSVGRGHLRQVAFACLRHRLGVAPSALARGLGHAELVQRLLDGVAVPSVPQSGSKA